ncbi:MAG: hypothetical protein V1876_04210 [Candidatus Peregrinibacteria bacterium]
MNNESPERATVAEAEPADVAHQFGQAIQCYLIGRATRMRDENVTSARLSQNGAFDEETREEIADCLNLQPDAADPAMATLFPELCACAQSGRAEWRWGRLVLMGGTHAGAFS